MDAFAHQPMMNRVLQESVALRERFENRLTATEQETANVRRSFESFKAQAVALGGIGLLVLGATASAVAFKLLGL